MKLFQGLSRGKLFGHPIHLMLVHFPAALLPTAAGLDAVRALGWLTIPASTQILLWPGVAIGWCAVFFGVWDLARLKPGSPEMSHALMHGGTNAFALSGFTIALLLSIHADGTMLQLWIELACAATIFIGNKLGGDLILLFGIGKMESQK